MPIVLATFPMLAGIQNAGMIFNMVFFIVIASVLLQGTTIPLVAKILGLTAPLAKNRLNRLEFDRPQENSVDLVELIVPYESSFSGKSIINLGLPEGCLISLICRGDQYILPRGTTVIEGGDIIVCLASEADLKTLQKLMAVLP